MVSLIALMMQKRMVPKSGMMLWVLIVQVFQIYTIFPQKILFVYNIRRYMWYTHLFTFLFLLGNKYWFIVRRIFIEEYNTGQIRYFTSVPQFEELMEALDNRYFEADLCQTIEFEKAEIERQMELTEKLTNDLKPSLSKKSYLELENQTIVKAQVNTKQTAKTIVSQKI